MESKTLTIPYLLESVTEREIRHEMACQLQGTIETVHIVPSTKPYKGRSYCTAVITYKPTTSNTNVHKFSCEEWSKSRNFP